MVRFTRRRRGNTTRRRRVGLRRAGMVGYRKRIFRGGNVHRFKEIVQQSSITAGANNNTSGRISFTISNLTNWAQYKELFDLYKITGVKVKIVPKFNMSSADAVGVGGAANGQLPMLYIAPNRDPYAPDPVSAADVLNDDGVKIIRVQNPINLYLSNPKPDITNEGGNIPFQFGVSKRFQPWLTTGGGSQTVDQENVTHYGFRWWMANGNGNYQAVLDVYVTYYFTMKEQN